MDLREVIVDLLRVMPWPGFAASLLVLEACLPEGGKCAADMFSQVSVSDYDWLIVNGARI
jgi:hypothetical protein